MVFLFFGWFQIHKKVLYCQCSIYKEYKAEHNSRSSSLHVTFWASMSKLFVLYKLSIYEKLPLTCVHLAQEHIWIFLDRELPFVQFSCLFSPMNRYYIKRCSSHMSAWYPFTNGHQMFPLSFMGTCQAVVVPESLILACSIWWNNRNHFDGVFKEYLSGILWHVFTCW